MTIARGWLWMVVLGLGACAAVPADPPRGVASAVPKASLAGTRWTGVVPGSTDHRAIPRIEFVREGRLSGFTGCNMFSGVWLMEGAEVRVGALVATKRLCLGPEGELEKRVFAALGEGNRGRREGDRLVFTAPGGASFEFAEAAAT